MSEAHSTSRVRVRYGETDQMGVAYHANYLVWCEIGRTDLMRALGPSYAEMEQGGLRLAVAEASLRYAAPARYDDELAVCCRVARLGRSSMTFQFEIYRQARVLITAELVYVNADPSTMKAAPLPEELRERVMKYERVAPQA